MLKAAEAINTFPIEGEQIFVLTASQLAGLMGQAVEKAIQPLKDRLSDLEEAMDLRAREIAQDRRRMAALEHEEPTPNQENRARILRALLVDSGGKILSKEARQVMKLKKNHFSDIIRVLQDRGEIITKPYHLDGRQKVIILNSELVPRGL